MKKIVRLTESDLLRLVKRVIKEQNTNNNVEYYYQVRPEVSGPVTITFVVMNNKIYSYDVSSNKIGEQIGGWRSTEEAMNAYEKKDRILLAGDNYVMERNFNNRTKNYFLNRKSPYDLLAYAFVFNQLGEPAFIGLTNTKYFTYAGAKPRLVSITEKPDTPNPTPTPLKLPNPPISLNLENAFYYDCPGKKGCGSKGGSNQEPLTNMNNLTKVKRLGKLLASISNWPAIKDNKFYVVGYASAENKNDPDFIKHNQELSKNRAQYIALYLNDAIKKNGGTITVGAIGKGPTEKFGKNLESNRKIILTTDPNSLTPTNINIKYNRDGKIIDVKVN